MDISPTRCEAPPAVSSPAPRRSLSLTLSAIVPALAVTACSASQPAPPPTAQDEATPPEIAASLDAGAPAPRRRPTRRTIAVDALGGPLIVRPDGTTSRFGLRDVAMITARDRSACAVARDGRLTCWGITTSAALGEGPPDPDLGIGPVVDVDVIVQAACAVTAAGEAICWGPGRLPPKDHRNPPNRRARRLSLSWDGTLGILLDNGVINRMHWNTTFITRSEIELHRRDGSAIQLDDVSFCDEHIVLGIDGLGRLGGTAEWSVEGPPDPRWALARKAFRAESRALGGASWLTPSPIPTVFATNRDATVFCLARGALVCARLEDAEPFAIEGVQGVIELAFGGAPSSPRACARSDDDRVTCFDVKPGATAVTESGP